MTLSGGDAEVQRTGSGLGFWDLLTGDEQHALSALGGERHYPRGATICVEGEFATSVFILMNGWVKILSVNTNGHTNVLALREDGDIVGETAGETTTGRRNATIQAIDPVCALTVTYDRFSSFLDSHPGVAHAFGRVMTQRWRDADEELRRRSDTTGAQRFAGLLLDIAERRGNRKDGEIHVTLPLSQEELASLAGTSRPVVTRALKSWRERGFIRTGQRRITIIDLPGLRRAAGQQE